MSQKLIPCLIMLFSLIVINNSLTMEDEVKLNDTIHYMLLYDTKKNWFTQLLSEYDLFKVFTYLHVPPKAKTICFICRAVLAVLIQLIQTNKISERSIIKKLSAICTISGIQKKDVCDGLVKLNIPYLYYIIRYNENIEAKTVCGQLLQFLGCAPRPPVWSLKIHEPRNCDKMKGEYIGRTLKILQITDIHYDSLYRAGSLANCGKPICCQKDSGRVIYRKDRAGQWTDYRLCDVSMPLLRRTLEDINKSHPDIDYVYFTGDIISHRVWDTSKSGNLRDIRTVMEEIRKHFDVPIFPIVGNHESHPANVFTDLDIVKQEFSTNWLFKELDGLWRKTMPNFEEDTILRGGYYTYLVRPGFRIVAINSNTAYTFNWWLMTDQIDIYRQLEWLNDVLYNAEGKGEYVHILSHIPSSDTTCHIVWSREFRRIIQRYYRTIAGIFNGHTHYDEFIVYHSITNPLKPIAVAWNGGSLTPYTDRNPNYRIYTVDAYNYPYLYYIVKNNGNIDAKVICGQMLQFLGCASSPPVWSLKIHEPQNFDKMKGEYIGRTLKILQITDIHYDSLYRAGSLANCGKPMCCQKDSGKVINREDRAGQWTDYRLCDVSMPLLKSTLEHMKKAHPDIDYVYSTGDIISHRVWDTSKHANIRDIREITELIQKYFDVPIFSIIGNHEPHPLNVFAELDVVKPEFSMNWLFKELDRLWRKRMPNFEGDTILKGGYYTYLVRPGFRIVAINSNTAYIFNWWLMTDQIDIYRQLEWLNDVLYSAEGKGEYVHILSHVPSSDSTCHKIWSREFRRIVQRYYHIIAGIFNGHTHNDEFIVYHSQSNPMKPIAVAWNGGSLTPYTDRNPNYRIYTIDAYNYDVLDYDDYVFNVTEANLSKQPPRWYKSYSFKEEYKLDDLSPSSVQDLVWKMAQNECWADLYIKHRLKDSDKPEECNRRCKRDIICQTVRSEFNNSRGQCDILYMNW